MPGVAPDHAPSPAPSQATLRHIAVQLVSAVCLALVVAAGGAGSAQADSFSWSAPISVDRTGHQPVGAVACPSATSCTTVDQVGAEVTFDPTSSNPNSNPLTVDSGQRLLGVACPTATQCTAIDHGGQEVTFDPTSSTPNSTAYGLGRGPRLFAVACPTARQCTAMDAGGAEVTFDPTSSTPNNTRLTVDGGRFLPTNSIACPSATQCTSVDENGAEVTFDPTSSTPNSAPVTVDSVDGLSSVACPSAMQCTAVDFSGNEVTFDPTSSTPNSNPLTVDGGGRLLGVACPSATQCTAIDQGGQEVTFDPTSSSPNSTPFAIDNGRSIFSVACPSTTQCTAAGDGGEVTFDPTSSTPNSTPLTVDTGQPLNSVACPTATQCTAVDGNGGEVTFDPTSSTPNGTALTIDSGQTLFSVSCPSATQCTATDTNGQEVTFDPTSSTSNSNPIMVDNGNWMYGVACPSATQCTAVDWGGAEVTFDPTSGSPNSSPVQLDGTGSQSLNGVACPSATQCTAVDSNGQEVTFDPTSSTPNGTPLTVDGTRNVSGVACPSATQCTAVDGNGGEVTFDPTSSTPNSSPTPIANANSLNGVACVSASECVAVDQIGNGFAAFVAPQNTSAPTISGAATQGRTLTEAHGAWAPGPSSFAYQWEDCDSGGSNCTAISGATAQTYALQSSDVGHTIRVRETARNVTASSTPASSAQTAVVVPAAPVNLTPPTISGTLQQGQTLTESGGTWTNSPTALAYQWQDCDAGGNHCSAISGATDQTYTLQASDVGDMIRVQETASNAGGAGIPAVSAQTGVVTTASAGSTITPPPPPSGAIGSVSAASDTATGVASAANAGTDVTGTGVGAFTLAQYSGDPVGPTTFGSTGQFLDVHVAAGSSFSSLKITDCNLGGGTLLEWWNGSSWALVEPQSYSAGPPACATATITATSHPSLSQLTGTVLAIAAGNRFTVSHLWTHKNGRITVWVKVPWQGRVDVLVTAWNDNLAHRSITHSARLLQPALYRFVVARAHTNAAARHSQTVSITVIPHGRGKRLIEHHTYRVTLRLWVSYTPTGGVQRDVGFYGLHLP